MYDVLGVELEDEVLLEEIRLVTDLMVAAAESSAALGQETIDRILCIDPAEPGMPIPAQRCSVVPGV